MNKISLFPNPSKDTVYINGLLEWTNISVYDLTGKEVIREFVKDKIDISCLEKGIYIINLTDGINTSSHKVIKN